MTEIDTEANAVLFSGGIESSYLLLRECDDRGCATALWFDWGQSVAELERAAAKAIAAAVSSSAGAFPSDRFGDVVLSELEIDLTADCHHVQFPYEIIPQHLRSDDRTPFVPFRNLALMFHAVRFRLAYMQPPNDTIRLVIGTNTDTGYPDSRQSFAHFAELTLDRSVPESVDVIVDAPLSDVTKTAVLNRGLNEYGTFWERVVATSVSRHRASGDDKCAEARTNAIDESNVDLDGVKLF